MCSVAALGDDGHGCNIAGGEKLTATAGTTLRREKEAGKKGFRSRSSQRNRGESQRARGFQIEVEEERGRPVPRELRQAEAAELELDLELGWL